MKDAILTFPPLNLWDVHTARFRGFFIPHQSLTSNFWCQIKKISWQNSL